MRAEGDESCIPHCFLQNKCAFFVNVRKIIDQLTNNKKIAFTVDQC